MSFFSGKKLILLGFILVLLAVIPVTVYFLQTQTTQTQTQAVKATTLYFALPGETTQTTQAQTKVGDSLDFDIVMNPGSNEVIAATLNITYDPKKLKIKENGFSANLIKTSGPQQGFIFYVAEPNITTPGIATMTMNIGTEVPRTIKSTLKIASISFTALEETPKTDVVFNLAESAIFSSVDQETSVLSQAQPISIAIALASTSATPTPTATSSASTNNVPVCTSLNIDRALSGPAPFSITFTALGNDTNGTITKATFNFGDGPSQDITSTGGIGTNNISAQVAHTYQNPGTFRATATLTDNNGSISTASEACSKTITVTAADPGSPVTTTQTPTASPTEAPTPTTIIAMITTAPPGPAEAILGIGFLGIGLAILGSIIFFVL